MGQRIRLTIRGTVQGVGFRPTVYRLANKYKLTGWVVNDPAGVTIEAEGSSSHLEKLVKALRQLDLPNVYYEHFQVEEIEPVGNNRFVIKNSNHEGAKRALMLPDIATCQECLDELFDPANRRFHYPFINCTHCGPRYSIITDLPYDRPNTTMQAFTMCDACREEYENPKDRRFHAQPNACPDCGPHMELWDVNGRTLSRRYQSIRLAAKAIIRGKIVAMKGLGGFQLLTNASNVTSVERLRKRKGREEKPFALMVNSLDQAKKICKVSKSEQQLLTSPQAPIVLLQKRVQTEYFITPSVAPGYTSLGLMLPYTPLHHLIMELVDQPMVATSGNLSDEPICIDENEALDRLHSIADLYLVHNRPIERHVDDSVVRTVAGKPMMLRRSRGYAPLPISVVSQQKSMVSDGLGKSPITMMALGGHLKNTIAINRDSNIFVSQYIGDLDNYEATKAYHKVADDLPRLYDLKPELLIHDLHPEYYSSKDAQKRPPSTTTVQHHYAHILSCMAEHQLDETVLGVAWDGTGYGPDETIWGGEWIIADTREWRRFATFRSFRLPGGDQAIREPRRASLAMLYELFSEPLFEKSDISTIQSFSNAELKVLRNMLRKSLNAPLTTSAGRIFDAVASLLNLYHKISYEGQAAIALENILPNKPSDECYPYKLNLNRDLWVVDWAPLIHHILMDLSFSDPPVISNKFHNTMVKIIVDIATRAEKERVVLSGGCFQNVYLTEKTIAKLVKHGFRPYWHQKLPPNDGGLAAGQLYYALSTSLHDESKRRNHEVPG